MVSSLTFRSLTYLSLLLFMVLENILILVIKCSCPVFPAPLTQEFNFSPLCILVSLVSNCLFSTVFPFSVL